MRPFAFSVDSECQYNPFYSIAKLCDGMYISNSLPLSIFLLLLIVIVFNELINLLQNNIEILESLISKSDNTYESEIINYLKI